METVEEFLARGGKVERDLPPPRQEKCSVPHGGVQRVNTVEHMAMPDMRRQGGRKMQNRSYVA